jgi:hypothetical protein
VHESVDEVQAVASSTARPLARQERGRRGAVTPRPTPWPCIAMCTTLIRGGLTFARLLATRPATYCVRRNPELAGEAPRRPPVVGLPTCAVCARTKSALSLWERRAPGRWGFEIQAAVLKHSIRFAPKKQHLLDPKDGNFGSRWSNV